MKVWEKQFNLLQVLRRKILGSPNIHCFIFMEASETAHIDPHLKNQGTESQGC